MTNIETLIHQLGGLQKELKLEELLDEALAEPIPTEQRLNQVEQALEMFRSLGAFGQDDARDLHILLTLGRTYEQLSHLEKAYETFTKALQAAERLKDQPTQALLLCRIGRVFSRWNRWAEALGYLDRSRQAYEALGDERGQAQVILNRGIIAQEQGDAAAAREAFETAIELGRKVDDATIVANASNNLAIIATIQGNLDEANERYQAALEMFIKIGSDRGIARAHYNLGLTHGDRKDWSAAMDSFEKGFEIAKERGYLDVMANIHLSMAEVLLELGNSLMVPLCCARALDIYRKLGDGLGEADTYRLLAKTFAMRKDWATAESLFRDSLRINEELENPLGVAETYRDLGKMMQSKGAVSDARDSLNTSLAGFRSLGAQKDIAEVEALLEDLS